MLDAAYVKSLPVITTPGEGVRWVPFEPADDPSDPEGGA